MPKPDRRPLLVLDFDDTLYNSRQWLADLVEVFEKHGAPEKVFWQAHQVLRQKKQLYSAYRHGSIVRQTLPKFPARACAAAVARRMQRRQDLVFADVKPLLQKVRRTHRIEMLTFGNRGWQERKVAGSGLGKFFNALHYTQRPKWQWPSLWCRPDVTFIEDKAATIDDVKKHYPHVRCIQILRYKDSNAERAQLADQVKPSLEFFDAF